MMIRTQGLRLCGVLVAKGPHCSERIEHLGSGAPWRAYDGGPVDDDGGRDAQSGDEAKRSLPVLSQQLLVELGRVREARGHTGGLETAHGRKVVGLVHHPRLLYVGTVLGAGCIGERTGQ